MQIWKFVHSAALIEKPCRIEALWPGCVQPSLQFDSQRAKSVSRIACSAYVISLKLSPNRSAIYKNVGHYLHNNKSSIHATKVRSFACARKMAWHMQALFGLWPRFTRSDPFERQKMQKTCFSGFPPIFAICNSRFRSSVMRSSY